MFAITLFAKRNNKGKVLKPKKSNKEVKKGVKNDSNKSTNHKVKRV